MTFDPTHSGVILLSFITLYVIRKRLQYPLIEPDESHQFGLIDKDDKEENDQGS